MLLPRTCPVCELPFQAVRQSQVCCTNACTVRMRRRREAGQPVSDREWAAWKAGQQRTDGLKTCPQCKQDKPLDEDHFYKIPQSDRWYSWCRECQNQRSLAQRRSERLRLLRHYGGDPPKCACCGDTTVEFLAIDHVEGGGNKHRAQLRSSSGSNFYGWLLRNKMPPGFRVLCHNCNAARGFYGYCPHERMKIT